MRVTTCLTRNWRFANALLAVLGLTFRQGDLGQSGAWVQPFTPLRTLCVGPDGAGNGSSRSVSMSFWNSC